MDTMKAIILEHIKLIVKLKLAHDMSADEPFADELQRVDDLIEHYGLHEVLDEMTNIIEWLRHDR